MVGRSKRCGKGYGHVGRLRRCGVDREVRGGQGFGRFSLLSLFFDHWVRFFLVLPSHQRCGWHRAAYSVVSSGEDIVLSRCDGWD